MRESQYTAAVHKKLPPEVYHWKISDRFRGGVADAWYSAASDLWVEYKYEDRPFGKRYTPDISNLQQEWLADRTTEGRNVALIMGSKTGAFIVTKQRIWRKQYTVPNTLFSKQDVANWILKQVT